MPELDAGLVHHAVDRRPAFRPVALDDQRPVVAVDRLVAEVAVGLDLAEQRKKIAPRPAGVAHRRPAVEIERRAPRRDRGVDHRRAAHQAAARQPDRPSAERAGAVGVDQVPVELGEARRLPAMLAAHREQRRHRLLVGEVRAGLKEQDAALLVSVSRAAITPPLDPAPTTMTSKWSMTSSRYPPRTRRGDGLIAPSPLSLASFPTINGGIAPPQAPPLACTRGVRHRC